jgi:hypothetical protein
MFENLFEMKKPNQFKSLKRIIMSHANGMMNVARQIFNGAKIAHALAI